MLTSKIKDDGGAEVKLWWFSFLFVEKMVLVTVCSTFLPIYIVVNCLLAAWSEGQQ